MVIWLRKSYYLCTVRKTRSPERGFLGVNRPQLCELNPLESYSQCRPQDKLGFVLVEWICCCLFMFVITPSNLFFGTHWNLQHLIMSHYIHYQFLKLFSNADSGLHLSHLEVSRQKQGKLSRTTYIDPASMNCNRLESFDSWDTFQRRADVAMPAYPHHTKSLPSCCMALLRLV